MPAQALPNLAPHHRAAIDRLVAAAPSVLALILGGSLAHGYARPESDVDVIFVVSAADHARRRAGSIPPTASFAPTTATSTGNT